MHSVDDVLQRLLTDDDFHAVGRGIPTKFLRNRLAALHFDWSMFVAELESEEWLMSVCPVGITRGKRVLRIRWSDGSIDEDRELFVDMQKRSGLSDD